MYKSLPAATTVAAIGMLASSTGIAEVGAVQLVTDQKHAHQQEDQANWNPSLITSDSQLIQTKKQLDQVEETLNQMKAETEVNLEIAEEESQSKKTKAAKKHNKKSKHSKKSKAAKKHAHKSKRLLDDDDEDEVVDEEGTTDSLEADDDEDTTEQVSADDVGGSESFNLKKSHKTHKTKGHSTNKKNHKNSKKSHSSHKKEKHASVGEKSTENAEEDDPFAAFEESLTKKTHSKSKPEMEHHEKHTKKSKASISHAQKKAPHKSHAHADSVPACTSLGCATASAGAPPPDPWPKDYPVANWGKDHDVETTEKNTAAAEGKLGAWVPQ